MEQRRYKEMYDEIKISEAKMEEIQMEMSRSNISKKRISFKRAFVLAASMMMVLSLTIVAGAQVIKTVRERLEEKGKIITYEQKGEDVGNELTPETSEIIITINDEYVEWDIDAALYFDENGEFMLDQLADDIMDEIAEEAQSQGNNNGSIGITMDAEVGEDGKVYIYVSTDDDPRNADGWYFILSGQQWYLAVNKEAEFDESVELVEKEGVTCIKMPQREEKEIDYYEFKYKGKKYAVAVWWYRSKTDMSNGNVHYTKEIIELEE